MKTSIYVLLLCFCCSPEVFSQTRFVTLDARRSGSDLEPVVRSFTIGEFETARLVSLPVDTTRGLNNPSTVRITRATNVSEIESFNVAYNRAFFQPVTIVGPAEIALVC